jgi:hypothetical protein
MTLRRPPLRRPATVLLVAAAALTPVLGCSTTLGDSGSDATTTTFYVTPPPLADVCQWMSFDNVLALVPESNGASTELGMPTPKHTHCVWEGRSEDGSSYHQLRLIIDREIDEIGEIEAHPIERAERRFEVAQETMLDDAATGGNTNVRNVDDLGDEAAAADYQGGVRLFIRQGVTVFELSYTTADRSLADVLDVLLQFARPLLDAYPDPEPG